MSYYASTISQPKMRQEGFHLPSPSPSNGNPPSPSSFDLFLPAPSQGPHHADSSGASLPTAFSRTGGGSMDFSDELAAIMGSSSSAASNNNNNNNGSGSPSGMSNERGTNANTPPYDQHNANNANNNGGSNNDSYRPTHNIFDISAPPSHYSSSTANTSSNSSATANGYGVHAFSLPHTSHRPELPPLSQPSSLTTSHLHGLHSPHGFDMHNPLHHQQHPGHAHTPHHLQHPHFLSPGSAGSSSATPPLSGAQPQGGRDAFPAHFNSTIPPLGTGAHHHHHHQHDATTPSLTSLSESFHSSQYPGPFSPTSTTGSGERETPSPGTPALNSAQPPSATTTTHGRLHSRHSQHRSPSRSRSRVRPGTASGAAGPSSSSASNAGSGAGGNGGTGTGAGPTRTTKGATKRRDSFTAGPHSAAAAQNSLPSPPALSSSPSSHHHSLLQQQQQQHGHRPSAITIPGTSSAHAAQQSALLNGRTGAGPSSPLGIGVGGMASMSLNTPTTAGAGAGGQGAGQGGQPSSFSSLGSSMTPMTPIGLGPLSAGLGGMGSMSSMGGIGGMQGMQGMGSIGIGGSSGWFMPSSTPQQQQQGQQQSQGQPPHVASPSGEYGLPTPESLGHGHGHAHAYGPYGHGATMGISPKETTLGIGAVGPIGLGAGMGVGGAKSESPPADVAAKQAAIVSEKRRRRRESHNAVERRRRDNINEKISELATLIPEVLLDPTSASSSTTGNANAATSADDADKDGSVKPNRDEKTSGTGDEETPVPGDKEARDGGKESAGGAPVKANKGMILRKSVEYIRYLQQLVNAQAARNRDLEAQLTRAGISPNPSVGAALPTLPIESGSAQGAHANGNASSGAAGMGHHGSLGEDGEQNLFGEDVLTLHTFADDGSYLPAGLTGMGGSFGGLEPMEEAEMEMEMDAMDDGGLALGGGGGPYGMDQTEDTVDEEKGILHLNAKRLLAQGGMQPNGKHLRHLRSASLARGHSASPGPHGGGSDGSGGDMDSPEGGDSVSSPPGSSGPKGTTSAYAMRAAAEERGRKDRFGRIGGDVGRLVAVKEESTSMEM